MMTGKCPKCGNALERVNAGRVNVMTQNQVAWIGVTYLCPFCSTILGVGADPSELKGEIGHEVADKIARLSMLKP